MGKIVLIQQKDAYSIQKVPPMGFPAMSLIDSLALCQNRLHSLRIAIYLKDYIAQALRIVGFKEERGLRSEVIPNTPRIRHYYRPTHCKILENPGRHVDFCKLVSSIRDYAEID